MTSIFIPQNCYYIFMIKLYIVALSLILVPSFASAEIKYPYQIDEKPRVVFGDSVIINATTTYFGLENFTQDYVNGYARFTYTYTHHRCCFSSHPPNIYITDVDPRSTSTPLEKYIGDVYTFLGDNQVDTDWYLYEIQFDSTGVNISVKKRGEIEIVNIHTDIENLKSTDWVAIVNRHPIFTGPAEEDTLNAMAFTPVPVMNEAPKRIDPIIIVPGIMGSAYKNGEWAIDPIFHVYDNLIETLEANGYTKDQNLFPFGYDWRNSNIKSAEKLKEKINEVKEVCDCDKVDIVAHSMGGLVTRSYVQSLNFQDDVDQIVFLGTPHRGAPKNYLTWEAGEFDKDLQSRYVKYYYDKEAKENGFTGENALFDYIKGWPVTSVTELLPVYNYLKDANTLVMKNYPVGYPENTFLVDLNQDLISFLEKDIDILNIVGNVGTSTISSIRVENADLLPLWEHGYPEGYDNDEDEDRGLDVGVGDGTVPIFSAQLGSAVDLEIQSGHVNLPTDAEEEIFERLNGGELGTTVKKPIPIRMLFAKIFSPADFVVIAPDGKRVGKNFTTGEEINEIEGAFYSGFNTEDEYVTIPDPIEGEYKIELKGTGVGGKYSFETTYISNEVSQTSEVSGVILPDQATTLNVEIDNESSAPIVTEREVTLDVLLNDINGAYNLGWIKDKKVRDNLLKEANFIIKFEKKKNGKYEKKVDKVLLKLVQINLDILFKTKKINAEARDLLKKDLIYIINNN